MSATDFQCYLLDNVEIRDLPGGDAIVFPSGALIGRAYRIPAAQVSTFHHWRLAALSPSPALRWVTRAAVVAGLVAAVLLGRLAAGAIPGIDFLVILAGLGVLVTIAYTAAARRFEAAFPMAVPTAAPARYRRLVQAYLCHPAFAPWKCLAAALGFSAAAAALLAVLWHSAPSLPVQNTLNVAAAGIVLAALIVFAAIPSWLTIRHVAFWRRYRRFAQPEDVQTLA